MAVFGWAKSVESAEGMAVRAVFLVGGETHGGECRIAKIRLGDYTRAYQ